MLGAAGHGKTELCHSIGVPVRTPREGVDCTGAHPPTHALRLFSARIDAASNLTDVSTEAPPFSSDGSAANKEPSLLALLDSPGEPSLGSLATQAAKLTDSAAIVVDCIEGLSQHAANLLRHCARSGQSLTLVLSKFDRLLCSNADDEKIYGCLAAVVNDANAVLAATSWPIPPRNRLGWHGALKPECQEKASPLCAMICGSEPSTSNKSDGQQAGSGSSSIYFSRSRQVSNRSTPTDGSCDEQPASEASAPSVGGNSGLTTDHTQQQASAVSHLCFEPGRVVGSQGRPFFPVIFTAGQHRWGFTLGQFGAVYGDKLGALLFCDHQRAGYAVDLVVATARANVALM